MLSPILLLLREWSVLSILCLYCSPPTLTWHTPCHTLQPKVLLNSILLHTRPLVTTFLILPACHALALLALLVSPPAPFSLPLVVSFLSCFHTSLLPLVRCLPGLLGTWVRVSRPTLSPEIPSIWGRVGGSVFPHSSPDSYDLFLCCLCFCLDDNM